MGGDGEWGLRGESDSRFSHPPLRLKHLNRKWEMTKRRVPVIAVMMARRRAATQSTAVRDFVIRGDSSLPSEIVHVQRARKRFVNLAKQDTGRARQKSRSRKKFLTTTYKLFPGPYYVDQVR